MNRTTVKVNGILRYAIACCFVHLIQNVQVRPGTKSGFMNIILIPDPFPLVHLKVRRLSLHSRYDVANPVGARRRPILLSLLLSSSSSRLFPNLFVPIILILTDPS